MSRTRMVCLHDKKVIEAFFRRNTLLHIYCLGDLDDRFWPGTTWYALCEGADIKSVSLMYSGLTLPTLLAMAEPAEAKHLRQLVRSVVHLLPLKFYGHLSPAAAEALSGQYALESHGLHHKMGLVDAHRLAGIRTRAAIVRLGPGDSAATQAFYDRAYPGNWFEAQMLDTGQYFSLKADGRLIAIAGVHVYSPEYKVAASGNIATDPTHRGKGHAKSITAALCRGLLNTVEHIGLNVKADNAAAIRCYESLGFRTIGAYEEYMAVASQAEP